MNNVTIKDFQLSNTWTIDKDGKKWKNKNEPKYLVDESTGRKYFNESKDCVRFKCILLSIGTPLLHLIATVINIIYRVLRIISFANFMPQQDEDSFDFIGGLKGTGIDAARIVLAPITLIGLELSSIYGWFAPYDGRKLYATIERASYGDFILAPCFQPDPKKHALGGDVDIKDEY